MIIFEFFITFGLIAAPNQMGVDEFIEKVKDVYPPIQAAKAKVEGAVFGSSAAEIVYSPALQSTTSYSDDQFANTSTSSLFLPSKSQAINHQTSLVKVWDYGISTSVSHTLQQLDSSYTSSVAQKYYTSGLSLTAEFSLWRNFLGKMVSAGVESARAELSAIKESEIFKIEQVLTSAKKVYWQLAAIQGIRKSIEESLERTQKILEWNEGRFKNNLSQESDLLQSKAALLKIQSELATTLADEETLERAFKNFIQKDLSEPLSVTLSDLKMSPSEMNIPESGNIDRRLDLSAVKNAAQAAAAEAEKMKQSQRPKINIFATYGGKGLDNALADSYEQTFDNSHRRYEIGVALEVPLGFIRSRDAVRSKERFAESKHLEALSYEQDLGKSYSDLKSRFVKMKSRLEVASELQKVQRRKLTVEEKRYKQGRSSSFQVLSFEEDLAAANRNLLLMSADARSLLADLDLFHR